jgi:hypothetical protein
MRRGWVQRALYFIGLLLFFMLIRVYVGSLIEYRKAELLLQQEQQREAFLHYGRAIRWYFPFNPYVQRSAEKILTLSQELSVQKKYRQALLGYQILQGSLASIRSFYQPHTELLFASRQEIARLTPLAEDNPKIVSAEVLDLYQQNRDPKLFWSVLSSLALLGWIAAVVGFICRSFSREGQFIGGKNSLYLGGAALFAWLIWIFGAWLA